MKHARIDHALIRTPVAWPLRIMIAVIVFIAGLGLLAAWTLAVGAGQMDQGLRGQMTVELPPDADGKPDTARIAALTKALEKIDGVTSARLLSAEQMAKLLRPWLGAAAGDRQSLAGLPLPQLIEVRTENTAAALRIKDLLQKNYNEASLFDHAVWLRGLTQKLQFFALALLGLVGILLAALISTIIFACRAGLNVQLPTINLLHIIGATDEHICDQMRRYAFRLVWPAGILGAFACAGASYGFSRLALLTAPNPANASLAIFWSGAVAIALLLPLLSCVSARASAGWATRRVLLAMP
jgi:cell division transport system permease protein